MKHNWLPKLHDPPNGSVDTDQILNLAFAQFQTDFLLSKPNWPGSRFAIKRHPERYGWPSSFWHLISEGLDEETREIKVNRCLYMAWPRAIIDEFAGTDPPGNSDRIVWWRNQRQGRDRLLIATPEFDYLVVIEERSQYVLLWTAYPARPHTAAKLRREHMAFWAGNG